MSKVNFSAEAVDSSPQERGWHARTDAFTRVQVGRRSPSRERRKRPAQVCHEYELDESLLLRWRREYEQRGEAAFTPRQPSQEEALEAHIALLERHCGQLSLELATIKKVLSRPASRSDTR